MNRLKLVSQNTNNNTIIYNFSVEGSDEFKSCFVEPYSMYCEYTVPIDDVPKSIGIIPFVCNILPIIWLLDAELLIDEIDSSFMAGAAKFKDSYKKMFPEYKWLGKVTAEKIVENHHDNSKSITLFTGGVDGYNTLLKHFDENPVLFSVWGADFLPSNTTGWESRIKALQQAHDSLGSDYITVKSNFREMLNFPHLNLFVSRIFPGYDWYTYFQHGISLLSLAVPAAHHIGAGKIYIASSYTQNDIGKDKKKIRSATDPSIDNYVWFADGRAIHDAFDESRQVKLQRIVEHQKKYKTNIPLTVCYMTSDGTNCCKCEKCCRTMLGLLAEKADPKDFGFTSWDEHCRKLMMYNLKHKYKPQYLYVSYIYIQDRFREIYTYDECPDDLKWFYKLKIHHHIPWYRKAYKASVTPIKKFLSVINLWEKLYNFRWREQ